MRDDALSRVSPDGPNYRVTEVNDNYSPHIFRSFILIIPVKTFLLLVYVNCSLILGKNNLTY